MEGAPLGARRVRFWRRLFGERRGAISPIMALFLIPLIGVLAMAAEVSGWFYTARSMQNAADSAALAVATSACTTVAACQPQAWAVTTRYGFQNTVNDVTVASTANTATCPSGATDCYKVTITRKVPFYLTKVVGYVGDTTTGSGAVAQTVQASSVAQPKGPSAGYCIMALGHGLASNKSAITIKGGSQVDLSTCDAYTAVSGSGTVDFAAPTSGIWSGVAMYQDPALTTVTSQSYTGNSPTFDITGLLYLPYTDLSFGGAINHQSGGAACIGLVVNTLSANGTGAALQHPATSSSTVDCLTKAGLVLPGSPGSQLRQDLVQ